MFLPMSREDSAAILSIRDNLTRLYDSRRTTVAMNAKPGELRRFIK